MCLVTERSETYDPEIDIDQATKKHNIVCVASVSFDQKKKEFDYSKFDPTVIGQDANDFADLKAA